MNGENTNITICRVGSKCFTVLTNLILKQLYEIYIPILRMRKQFRGVRFIWLANEWTGHLAPQAMILTIMLLGYFLLIMSLFLVYKKATNVLYLSHIKWHLWILLWILIILELILTNFLCIQHIIWQIMINLPLFPKVIIPSF